MKILHISKVRSFFNFKNIKGCQLRHLHSQAAPQHISAMRKASFVITIWCVVLEHRACIYSGHPTTVFSEICVLISKNCVEFSIARGRLKISR